MKNIFIILVLSFCCALYLHGQSNCPIVCDSLLITFEQNKNYATDSLIDNLHIEAYLTLNDYRMDTLNFYVQLGLPIPELGIKNLQASGFDGNRWTAMETNNNGLSFNVFLKPNIKKVNFSYDTHGFASFYFNDSLSFGKLFVYQSDGDNLIVKNTEMQINEITFKNNFKNTLAFDYFENNGQNDCYNLSGYSIVVIDTFAFKNQAHTFSNLRYSIFDQHSESLNSFNNIKDKYNGALYDLLKYEPARNSFTVIASNYRSKELRAAYGKAFGNFFYCDTSFLTSPVSLLHETIHILYPVNVQKNSKGEYFIGESLTEWVSNYLINGEFILPDTISIEGNLIDTEINNKNTWKLIYYKGPFVLQNVAEKTSPKILYDTVMSFFLNNRDNTVDFNDFIAFLQDKGFKDETIEYLKTSLGK